MSGKPIPNDCYLHQCENYKVIDGKKVWRNIEKTRLYTWDSMHGEIEVFDVRGYHLGTLNPKGEHKKDPIRGRHLNV